MYPDPRVHAQIAADRAELLRVSYGRNVRRRPVRLRLPAWTRSSSAGRLRSSRA
jgi:hypothetical protein